MRILNTQTKKLEELPYIERRISMSSYISNLAPYAILSHCWRDGEVQFQDISRPGVEKMKGYAKLSAACDTARRLGIGYLWMDTCCIDKSSSSELSEAINSMYKWYREAFLCIVYLDDVDAARWDSELKKSRWFTRGWTLQELIAPRTALFYDIRWSFVDTKESTARVLAEITGITEDVLRTGNTDGISVAAKMAWAATRRTTREEDVAYSLMGIFDVNMPAIYGEGDKAFMRLQEEIMKKSNDQSIFAWGMPIPQEPEYPWVLRSRTLQYSGLLARSPSSFRDMNDVVQMPLRDASHVSPEFTLTNRGIHVRLPIRMIDHERNIYMAFLACGKPEQCAAFVILLQQISGDQYARCYSRGSCHVVEIKEIKESELGQETLVFVNQHVISPERSRETRFLIHLRRLKDAFKRWGYSFHNDSGPSQHFCLDHGKEDFVIVKYDNRAVYMLIASIDDMERRLFCVRAIALGASEQRSDLSPRQIYEMRCDDPQLRSSEPPVIKAPDGQEFGLAVILTYDPSHQHNNPSWDVLGVPRAYP